MAAAQRARRPRRRDRSTLAAGTLYLCLLLSTLLSSGVQVLLSAMARRLAELAFGIDGLGFDADERAHRTAFVDVVRHLESLDVLRLRDALARDLDEDAYDVDHEAVHLITPALALRDW